MFDQNTLCFWYIREIYYTQAIASATLGYLEEINKWPYADQNVLDQMDNIVNQNGATLEIQHIH